MKQGDANSLRGVDDAEPPFKRRPVLAPARELAAAGAVGPNDPTLGLLTGDEDRPQVLIDEEVTFETFFKQATLNPNAPLIKGVICGDRIEGHRDPADATDALPRQARRRNREGPQDGEDPPRRRAPRQPSADRSMWARGPEWWIDRIEVEAARSQAAS